MIDALGGADRTLALARNAMAAGDYRWSSDLLQQLVFAQPDNAEAKSLLADSYEQQGYQSESAIWRNQFLASAFELRNGAPDNFASQSPDLISAVPTQLLLDSAATRFAPGKLDEAGVTIAIDLIDRGERMVLEANDRVMIGRNGEAGESADATIRGPRQLLLALLFLKMPLAQLQAAGLQVEGDAQALQELLDAIDPMPQTFPIITP